MIKTGGTQPCESDNPYYALLIKEIHNDYILTNYSYYAVLDLHASAVGGGEGGKEGVTPHFKITVISPLNRVIQDTCTT
jgi:hypothetical protein